MRRIDLEVTKMPFRLGPNELEGYVFIFGCNRVLVRRWLIGWGVGSDSYLFRSWISNIMNQLGNVLEKIGHCKILFSMPVPFSRLSWSLPLWEMWFPLVQMDGKSMSNDSGSVTFIVLLTCIICHRCFNLSSTPFPSEMIQWNFEYWLFIIILFIKLSITAVKQPKFYLENLSYGFYINMWIFKFRNNGLFHCYFQK